MKSIIRIIILCSLFLYCSNDNHNKIPPKAVKGVLDLSNWDLEKDDPVDLIGEWEFYWKEFVQPDSRPMQNAELGMRNEKNIQNYPNVPNSPLPIPNYINVPGNWNKFEVDGKPIGGQGYASYRLRVLLPKSNYPLTFKIPDQATAYTMYVNGEKLTSMGIVGKDKDTSIPGSFSVISLIQKPKEELEILFHVSNFHYGKGGLWLPIKLGDEKKIREIRDKNLFLDLFLAGSILIMGVYHLVIFIQRKEDKSPLFFGIYCIIIVMRLISTGEKYLITIFPEISFQLLIKIEYLSFYLAVPIFSHFLYTIFPREAKERILILIWGIGILFSTSVALTPTEFFTRTISVYQFFTLVCLLYFLFLIGLAIFRKRDGSKAFLAGGIILIIGVVNDIFYNSNKISSGYIIPQCLLGFIFFQSIILSMRFSKSFTRAEKLSNELEQKSNRLEETSLELSALTQNLELKIEERTKDLEETKKEIENLNTFSHLINSLSDLNSIFIEISKYFYHKFGITGVWLFLPDEKREFLGAYKVYSYNKLSEDKYHYLMNGKVPMKDNEGGILYKTFLRKKPFYLSKIPKFEFGIDKEIVNTLSLTSLLQVPLVRKDECVGIFSFSNMQEELKLSKKEINSIANLCSQIAGSIDTNHLLKQVEKARANADAARIEAEIERGISVIAKLEVEKAKKKTEELNQLIKKVNETSDLEEIMKIILSYVKDNYNLPYYSLFTLDPKENLLKFANAIFPDYITSEHKKMISSNVLSVTEKNIDSVHSRALSLKTPIFLPDAEAEIKTKTGRAIQRVLKHKSFVTLPIILQNNPIGTLDFFSLEPLNLREEEITELSLLAEQLAGVIQGATLFTQVQEEKEKAILAYAETEKQKRETEELNKLIKSLNEELDIKVIMEKILHYVNLNFGIQYYALYKVTLEKTHIEFLDATYPAFLNNEEREKIVKLKIPINQEKGAHSFVIKTKKPFFVPKVQTERVLNAVTFEERFIIELGEIQSFLIIPLILNNEPIGILDFHNSSLKMDFSKEDITRLSILGEQLAGIINGSNLFKQVQEEKEKANAAREESEKVKAQIEFLNEFSKAINSYNNLDIIFSHAVENLLKKIDTNIVQLQLIDKAKNELFTRCMSGTDSDLLKKYNKLRVPLNLVSGSVYSTYTSKKVLYLRNTKKIPTDKKSDLDKMIEKDFQVSSVFQVPLLVNEAVIGIMHINKMGGMKKLNKDEILFVESLCEQLALAVNNSFLLEATEQAREEAESERQKSEKLLLNILPKDVASELKEKGFAEPVLFENVSVMFTDFKGFTTIAEKLSPQELIKDLDACFVQFDKISERFNLEKLKTIGDSYMCAGGIPKRNKTHAIDCCLAALEIQSFMNIMKRLKEDMGFPYWELRLGIHTGPLIAGVIGERKFAYDVWGDTVNTASRMESSGTPGRINISYSTYEVVKDYFECEYRGEVSAKNKGVVKMYYLVRIKPEFSKDEEGLMPNGKFWEMYG